MQPTALANPFAAPFVEPTNGTTSAGVLALAAGGATQDVYAWYDSAMQNHKKVVEFDLASNRVISGAALKGPNDLKAFDSGLDKIQGGNDFVQHSSVLRDEEEGRTSVPFRRRAAWIMMFSMILQRRHHPNTMLLSLLSAPYPYYPIHPPIAVPPPGETFAAKMSCQFWLGTPSEVRLTNVSYSECMNSGMSFLQNLGILGFVAVGNAEGKFYGVDPTDPTVVLAVDFLELRGQTAEGKALKDDVRPVESFHYTTIYTFDKQGKVVNMLSDQNLVVYSEIASEVSCTRSKFISCSRSKFRITCSRVKYRICP